MPRRPLSPILSTAFAALVGCSNPTTPLAPPATLPAVAPPAAAIVPPPAISPAAPRLPAGPTRDAYVLLSGGGTPLSNNYSQYLQARAIAAFFERECPPESTWVFFGIGNRDGAPPLLADSRRELKRDGLVLQSWLPGTLKNNRPATRESFLKALREEILPTVRGGGTLYLFVGDHGREVGTGEKKESAITLWQLKRRPSAGWFTDAKEILGVAELQQILADGLGDGRVVFCMTQCHAGGFHELGVRREMPPPREWFRAAPASARGFVGGWRLRVAGFTATDQASAAAGCDADPDPDQWAGYERFLPESLLGIDLLSGAAKGQPARSLAEAHVGATLVDRTIDKPRATSEHYLEAWARTIETRLVGANLTSPAAAAVANFQRAVDTGRLDATEPAFRERQAQLARFTAQLIHDAPAAAAVLSRGTKTQLEAEIRARGRGAPREGARTTMTELRRLWTEVLRPAWKAAVLGGKVPGLDAATLAFEKRLLAVEDEGKQLLLPRGANDTPLLNEIFWSSSYAVPRTFNPQKAQAVTRWGAERRTRIVEWARRAGSPAVREAAQKIGPAPTMTEEAPRPMSRRTAAERVLYYRRVLAAWQFLIAMDARPALAELQSLIELERLPVRPAT